MFIPIRARVGAYRPAPRTHHARAVRRVPAGIRYCEHDDGDGEALFQAACRMGLEGIISKRADSRYRSGRCKMWVKSKNPRAPSVLRVHDGLDG